VQAVVDYRPEISRAQQNGVIRLSRSIFDCGENVLALKIRIIAQNLVEFGSGTQQFEDIGNPDSHPANARTAPALGRIERYAIEMTGRHRSLTSLNPHQSGILLRGLQAHAFPGASNVIWSWRGESAANRQGKGCEVVTGNDIVDAVNRQSCPAIV